MFLLRTSPRLTLLLILLITYVDFSTSEKILFLLPLACRSETHVFVPLAKELAIKGHDIVFVSPISTGIKIRNFVELNPLKSLSASDFDPANTPSPQEMRKINNNPWFLLTYNISFIHDGCHQVYKNPEFMKLMDQHFDLLIVSAFFNDCFQGLVHKFQAPFILLSSMPVTSPIVEYTGLRQPFSFVPNSCIEFTDRMTFKERLVNHIMEWTFGLQTTYINQPGFEKIYRQYLGEDTPSIRDIIMNVSIILSNAHFSVTTPRPYLPDIVEIGGIHCQEPVPLAKELEDFVSGPKDGFIFFSMGSVLQGSSFSEKSRKMFLKVFSKLKQRVLWKWETETMPELPSNVKLSKWLPQQDILGHKNIRLFISHGGLLSTQEAVYHGVPVIGLPVWVDQNVNMKLAAKMGFAINLELLELNEEVLETSIKDILSNPSYSKKAKEISKIFKDQPSPPLQKAVYWTEYVLRHKGATHLRSAARDLNFIQYHSFDVIGFLIASFSLSLYLIVKIATFICCSKKQGDLSSEKSKKKKTK